MELVEGGGGSFLIQESERRAQRLFFCVCDHNKPNLKSVFLLHPSTRFYYATPEFRCLTRETHGRTETQFTDGGSQLVDRKSKIQTKMNKLFHFF